jgi:hypothetical protein
MRDTKATERAKTSEEIGTELEALLDRFGAAHTKLKGIWKENFNNVHREIPVLIRGSDSDIHDWIMDQVYYKKWPLETLDQFTIWDDEAIKPFGIMLTKFRFGIGYVGNLSVGQIVKTEHCAWMIFAYEAYWRYEDNYFIGNIGSSLLSRVGKPSGWPRAEAKALRGRADYIQRQELALDIATALLEIHRYRRIMSPAMANVRSHDHEKPAFIDFRSKLEAIKAPPRAKPKAKTSEE